MTIVHFGYAPTYRWDYDMVDFPRDLLFALDQLAAEPPEGLQGIIDTDNVGVAGYSGEGDTAFRGHWRAPRPRFLSLTMRSGSGFVPDYLPFWSDYACHLTEDWEAFASAAGDSDYRK